MLGYLVFIIEEVQRDRMDILLLLFFYKLLFPFQSHRHTVTFSYCSNYNPTRVKIPQSFSVLFKIMFSSTLHTQMVQLGWPTSCKSLKKKITLILILETSCFLPSSCWSKQSSFRRGSLTYTHLACAVLHAAATFLKLYSEDFHSKELTS